MKTLSNICLDVTPEYIMHELEMFKDYKVFDDEIIEKFLIKDTCNDSLLNIQEMDNVNSPKYKPVNKDKFTRYIPLELLGYLAVNFNNKWENGTTLRVKFFDDIKIMAAQIMQYACEWSKYCNIDFKISNDIDSEIRISSTKTGSWSYIGKSVLAVPTDQATMNFGWYSLSTSAFVIKRTVLHEFGHALGCIHEHQRPDVVIKWNKEEIYRRYGMPPNSWDKRKVDTNIFARYSEKEITNSIFDSSSIMIYPIEKWQTIDGYQVSWNDDLSNKDKQFIGKMYPF